MQNEDGRDTSAGVDDPAPKDPSRRGFLIGSAAAVVVAGGIGAVLAITTERSAKSGTPSNPPADLLAAAVAERALIAEVDRAIAGRSASAAHLTLIRANHQAHLAALEAAVALAQPSAPAPTSRTGTGSSAPATPLSATQLAVIEQSAAKAAAATAARLIGNDATLLASIAACEACHAELLR